MGRRIRGSNSLRAGLGRGFAVKEAGESLGGRKSLSLPRPLPLPLPFNSPCRQDVLGGGGTILASSACRSLGDAV